MIKTVMIALVLIVGAAVVLWYGNTLNSWVLSGFIGGFGAVLLSIPISFVLFSYLSRHARQDQPEDEREHHIPFADYARYAIIEDDEDDYFDEPEVAFAPVERNDSLFGEPRDAVPQRLISTSRDGEQELLLRRESTSRLEKSARPQIGASYSQYRSDALRAARLEAALRSDREAGQNSARDRAQVRGTTQRSQRIVDALPRR